ncbi:MAG: DUF1566 domain-containing protein [Legionellales bacterium RIFCSPHIGHO2_12_FULL_42_9]|nr:MAG: DUF1566 domain-containing protein [Legionellales bacterium RIFCSPHIGHO2_12_FULL_42_9]
MKTKSLLPLLLFFSITAEARPGDDIWNNISELYAGVNSAKASIAQTNNEVTTIRSMLDTNNAQLQTLSSEIESIKSNKNPAHYIGEKYRGGLIFYIDESGQHGLVASLVDVNSDGIEWRNGESGNKVTNARADGIGAGETNTRLIIAQQTADNQNGQFAALLASNFQVLDDGVTPCKTPIASESICYSGWYLPSAYELQLMHNNLNHANLSSFTEVLYWSSTEASVSKAWVQNFATGEITAESKSNILGRVRAINHF